MRKSVLLLLSVFVLLLTVSSLAAQPPEPQTRLLPNRVILDPGPDQDWAAHERQMGQIAAPVASPAMVRSAPAGQWDYVVYDTLIVIYTTTYAGTIDASQVEVVKDQVRAARDFLWRNSHFKLYLNLEFLVIDYFNDGSEFWTPWTCGWLWPSDYDGDGESPELDLLARGINTADYDSINLIWAHNAGTVSPCAWGLAWPNGWNWADGGHTAITTNALIYAYGEDVGNPFHHEFQHSLDGAFDLNGNPDYFHADYPWKEPYRFGENWHFHGVEMRAWPIDDWFDLLGEWGHLASAPDADGDGLPDSGDLPLTEASLGSDPSRSDSEGDGRSDRDEAMAGYFHAADPTQDDSDGDGRLDGADDYALYDLMTYIPQKTQAINGNPAGWPLITGTVTEQDTPLDAELYAAWKYGVLYLMVVTDKPARVDIMLDGNADGYFQGRDNYHFELQNTILGASPLLYVSVQDCSARQTSLKTYCQYDTEASYSFGRLVTKADFQAIAAGAGGKYIVQLAVPADSDTQFNPRYGSEIGLRLYFSSVDDEWRQEAWTFEFDEQVYLPLRSNNSGILRGQVTAAGVCDENTAPVADLKLTIQGETGGPQTASTDSEGRYSLWLRANQGPFTITAGDAPNVPVEIGGVTITPQDVTVQDIALRRDAPCLQADPGSVEAQLHLGETSSAELTITNSGAGGTLLHGWLSYAQAPAMPWAALTPQEMEILPDGEQKLELQLDASEAALGGPGVYQAVLNLAHPEGVTPYLTVPVTLEAVTCGVALQTAVAAGSGAPGTTVDYTIELRNEGSVADSFNLQAVSAWEVTLPATVGPLQPGEQRQVRMQVQIPEQAVFGESESALITAVSQMDADETAVLQLTTTVAGARIVLPIIIQ